MRNQSSLKLTVAGMVLLLIVFSQGVPAEAQSSQLLEMKVTADSLLKQGELVRAISLYEKVLRQDAKFANAYYNLATAYYLDGQLRKAIQNLETFLKLHPQDAEALYNLGCLKLRVGGLEEAWDCFMRAEKYPCSESVSGKISEALRFTKDLRNETPETQDLVAFLVSL